MDDNFYLLQWVFAIIYLFTILIGMKGHNQCYVTIKSWKKKLDLNLTNREKFDSVVKPIINKIKTARKNLIVILLFTSFIHLALSTVLFYEQAQYLAYGIPLIEFVFSILFLAFAIWTKGAGVLPNPIYNEQPGGADSFW